MRYINKIWEWLDKLCIFFIIPFTTVCIALDYTKIDTSDDMFDRFIIVFLLVIWLVNSYLKMYSSHLQKKIDKDKESC